MSDPQAGEAEKNVSSKKNYEAYTSEKKNIRDP